MESVVGETFGHVLGGYARLLGERTKVEDAFVGNPATLPRVEDRKTGVESSSNVVGRQDRHPSRLSQSGCSHETEVGVWNSQNSGRSERSA